MCIADSYAAETPAAGLIHRGQGRCAAGHEGDFSVEGGYIVEEMETWKLIKILNDCFITYFGK